MAGCCCFSFLFCFSLVPCGGQVIAPPQGLYVFCLETMVPGVYGITVYGEGWNRTSVCCACVSGTYSGPSKAQEVSGWENMRKDPKIVLREQSLFTLELLLPKRSRHDCWHQASQSRRVNTPVLLMCICPSCKAAPHQAFGTGLPFTLPAAHQDPIGCQVQHWLVAWCLLWRGRSRLFHFSHVQLL